MSTRQRRRRLAKARRTIKRRAAELFEVVYQEFMHDENACSENPRQRGDDDGREYGHPADAMEGRE